MTQHRVARPGRSDVLRRIDELFPESERAAALEAVDVFVGPDECVRARVQLTILDRSEGNVNRARAIANHLLAESAPPKPAPDPATLRNERYAG